MKSDLIFFKNATGALFILVSLGALTSCAINPYIENPRPGGISAPYQPVEDREYSIGFATQYADNIADRYQSKINEEFIRQQSLSNGLISLGAVALGMSIGGANKYWIGGAALGGGAVWELGKWNTNTSRINIYEQGIRAVYCAKRVVTPFAVGAKTTGSIKFHRGELENVFVQTSKATGRLNSALMDPKALVDANSELQKNARTELAYVDTLFNKANRTIAHSANFENRVSNSAVRLTNALNLIQVSVNSALNGTLSDLSNLPKVISNLSMSAAVFGVLPTAPKISISPPAAPSATATAQAGIAKTFDNTLAMAYGELKSLTPVLAQKISQLDEELAESLSADVKADLDGCNIEQSKLNVTLRLSKESVELSAGAASASTVKILYGTMPFSVTPTGTIGKGITVTVAERVILISSDVTAEPGKTYVVEVSDSTNAISQINISTSSKDEAPAKITRSATQAPKCSVPKNTSTAEICLIQKYLKVNIDGTFGDQTCIAYHNDSFTKASRGLVDKQTLDGIKTQFKLPTNADEKTVRSALGAAGNATCPTPKSTLETAALPDPSLTACVPIAPGATCKIPDSGARCDLECRMSSGDLQQLRKSLSLQALPLKFDDTLRTAIAKYQSIHGLSNRKGDYTAETASSIDKELKN